MTLSLTSILLPIIFNPAIVPSLHPARVFWPPPPTSVLKVACFADGMHIFLQYDELIGFIAALVWALALNRNGHGNSTKAAFGPAGWLRLLAKVAAITLVAGPGSAMVALVWERDEYVLGGGE